MTGLALALVLLSAMIHASWNYLAKRAGGGTPFLHGFTTLSLGIYAPLALIVLLWQMPPLGVPQLGFVAGSAALHVVYFLMLSRGYQTGDLSLVYPLARGTGPLLSTLAAIALLGERPTGLALAGAVLIGLGVFLLLGDPRRLRAAHAGRAARVAFLTGVLIASYTLWDKQAVSVGLIPPLLYDWTVNLGRVLLLTPYGLRHWPEVRRAWQGQRRAMLGVAVLSPLSYILMLTALAFSPVSYVAPAREIGILFGAILGTRLLAEGHTARRLLAASAMVGGVVALALG